jgi:flagellar biosynthetic protein FliR
VNVAGIDIQQLVGGNFVVFTLVLARVGGMFAFAPVFASRTIPMRIRLILALVISVIAVPHAANAQVPVDPLVIAPLMVKEVLVGSALAFAVAGVYAAVEMAGSLVDTTIGFALANVVDPTLNFQSTVLAQLYSLLAMMIFLGSGAHLVMIGGIVRSFDVLPIDRTPSLPALSQIATHGLAPIFVIALQVAAPVIATLFVTDVAFGLLARLVPQLQPMAVQFSVKILVGLSTIAVSVPLIIHITGARFADALTIGGLLPGAGP